MRLSDLHTGESGVIVKVNGHGGFRKRIVEMGFIKGQPVDVILNAPLHDPVKYRIMDYEVSLRRAEAELIEVVTEEEAEEWKTAHHDVKGIPADHCAELIKKVAQEKGKELTVVFVGNPNCGKTSIFNIASGAHERVGNYSGVTVDAKDGNFSFGEYKFHVVDLPGTYSLSAYSPEELYVRKYIIEKTPDVIINVVDASNLERNLYLTTQLIDMDVPIVMALNMYDELRDSGNKLSVDQLGELLGVPVVPTVGRTGEGIKQLFQTVIDVQNGDQKTLRHIHINHGQVIESNIAKVERLIRENPEPHHNYSGRFLAIKLLENDKQVESIVQTLHNAPSILETRDKCKADIMRDMGEDSESAITDAKYGFIQGALRECFIKRKKYNRMLTKVIDSVVTHPFLGYPVFILLMYLMFYCTFNIGQYPMDWIDALVGWIGDRISALMPDGALKALLVDGIIGGVGGVIVFLPNIMILYAFISWMEDSGYMARAAFIMDKIMHKMGLHGKSFIPMIMGFGCNIPAIMATRTIEDRKSRLITMLIIPLMSCSARLPVYIIIIGAFFPHHSALTLTGLYVAGIVMSVIMAKLFSRFVVKGKSSPFVMELPPYRLPSAKSVARHTWEKGKQYLKKMGTTILLASIIVWALSYYPQGGVSDNQDSVTETLAEADHMENSYMGRLGHLIEPVIRPCGFNWQEGVSILAGTGAKEIVASTMGVLYSSQENTTYEETGDEDEDSARLSSIVAKSGLTPLAAFSFLIFVLLYMPCIPACVTIKSESGHTKWALFTIAYTTSLAWICSTLVYQVGSLIL